MALSTFRERFITVASTSSDFFRSGQASKSVFWFSDTKPSYRFGNSWSCTASTLDHCCCCIPTGSGQNEQNIASVCQASGASRVAMPESWILTAILDDVQLFSFWFSTHQSYCSKIDLCHSCVEEVLLTDNGIWGTNTALERYSIARQVWARYIEYSLSWSLQYAD